MMIDIDVEDLEFFYRISKTRKPDIVKMYLEEGDVDLLRAMLGDSKTTNIDVYHPIENENYTTFEFRNMIKIPNDKVSAFKGYLECMRQRISRSRDYLKQVNNGQTTINS